MLIEQRKSFQIFVATLSMALSFTCWLTLRPLLANALGAAQFAFASLLLASMLGFMYILKLLLPLFISKLWPQLEAPTKPNTGNSRESL